MATGDVGKLSVDIEARLDKLEKNLKAALSKTKDAARKMEQASKVDLTPVIQLANITRSFGAIEIGLGAIETVASLITGDFDRALATLKIMPLGIGPVVTKLESMLQVVLGTRKGLQAIADEIDRLNKRAARDAPMLAAFRREQQVAEEAVARTRAEAGLIGKKGADAAFAAVKARTDAAIRAIEQRRDKNIAAIAPGAPGAERSKEVFGELAERQILALERKRQKEIAAIRKLADQDESKRKLAFIEKRNSAEVEAIQKQVAMERRLGDINSTTRQAQLRLVGREADSVAEGLRHRFDVQIREAEAKGQENIADALRQQKRFELAGLERQGQVATQAQVFEKSAFDIAALAASLGRDQVQLTGAALAALQNIDKNTRDDQPARAA